MALCSAANWLFNFLLAFFTPFITSDIGFAATWQQWLSSTSSYRRPITRSSKEIDTMFRLVKQVGAAKGKDLIAADKLMLNRGSITD